MTIPDPFAGWWVRTPASPAVNTIQIGIEELARAAFSAGRQTERETSEHITASAREYHDRLDNALKLAIEILASFHLTSDGHRARAGQIQIRRWQQRINELADPAEPIGADAQPGELGTIHHDENGNEQL